MEVLLMLWLLAPDDPKRGFNPLGELSARDGLVILVTYLVLIAVLVLAMWWWS